VCIGLGLASGRRALWVIGAVAAVLADPPWFVQQWLFEGHDWSLRMLLVITALPQLAKTAVQLVFAVLASRDTDEAPDPRLASDGLMLASQALWLRVIAAGVAVLLVLLVAMASQS